MVAILLIGCSGGGDKTDGQKDGETTDKRNELELSFDSSLSGEITFWTWVGDMFEEIIPDFNKVYPNIKVNVIGMDFNSVHEKLQTTLAAGSGAPDLTHIGIGEIPRFNSELLEDLLQPPYNAGRYQEDVYPFMWEVGKSANGKQLLALPWDITPGVFYYRADIYEQMGLPTDPDELGEYLQDPDNVLTAAQTLAANDMYMYEWADSPVNHYGDEIGYFDNDYKWVRNNEKMAQMLDFTKKGGQVGWAPHVGFNSDEGKQLIKQGKLVSFPLGSWGANELEIQFQEQSGKWQVTTMPFGIYPSQGGSAFAIPAQSKNKEAAWAFAEWFNRAEESWKVFTDHSLAPAWKHISALPWYQEYESEFLSGQQIYKMYDKVANLIPIRRMTILDGPAWSIYLETVAEGIENNIDSKVILQQVETNIYRQLEADIEKLKQEEGKS